MKQFVNGYDKALDAITSGMLDTSDIEPYRGAIAKALKKHIPMTPESTLISNKMLYWHRCPICHSGITQYYSYCHSCGQMLNWDNIVTMVDKEE